MAERLVNADRETPMLLSVDLRDWVPEDDPVHFVISAMDGMPLSSVKVNYRGTGSKQYPPSMMLALLIYCYANGVFSSRRIERMTYRDIGVRYLTGDTHPDHDTICTFRRENSGVVREAFVELLKLAQEMGLLRVGTVSVDGTHIRANASKHKSVRYDRAVELEQQLREDVARLLEEAERSDAEGGVDEQSLPQEIARREKLREKLEEARRALEERVKEEAEAKGEADEGEEGGSGGEGDGGGEAKVEGSKQINLTDPDSGLMRKSKRSSWEQAYNAQAAVDAEGSQLVVGCEVITTPSDANQLEAAIESVPECIGEVKRVLADGGYVNVAVFERLQDRVELYVAITEEEQNERRYDFRPSKKRKPKKKITNPTLVAMREKLSSEEGRGVYARRACTVEPVFGIIKAYMGFRQFLLRGIEKVKVEWDPLCLASNGKRMWNLAWT